MDLRLVGVGCLLICVTGCPGDDTMTEDGGDGSSTGGTTMSVVTTLGNDASDGGTTMGGTADGTDEGTTTAVSTTDTGDTDDASTDSGTTDTGSTDSGSTDSGSTDTASTDSGSTDTGGTDTGEPIVCMGPPPDMECDTPSPYMGAGTCDPYAQDCPVGDKCMPWANDGGSSWNSTTCSPIAVDPGQIGDVCTVEGSGVSGVDDCDLGLMCWNVDPETNMGECIELCGCGPDEPTCGGGGTTCVIVNSGVLPLCLGVCDPLGDDCLDGEVCVGVPDEALSLPADYFFCAPDASGDMAQPGDPCEFLNVCPVGTMCLDASLLPGGTCFGAGCCTEICDEGNGGAECSIAGTDCVSLYEEGGAPEACLEDVGFCGAP